MKGGVLIKFCRFNSLILTLVFKSTLCTISYTLIKYIIGIFVGVTILFNGCCKTKL